MNMKRGLTKKPDTEMRKSLDSPRSRKLSNWLSLIPLSLMTMREDLNLNLRK
jgi:hypothetical protein